MSSSGQIKAEMDSEAKMVLAHLDIKTRSMPLYPILRVNLSMEGDLTESENTSLSSCMRELCSGASLLQDMLVLAEVELVFFTMPGMEFCFRFARGEYSELWHLSS